MEGQDDKHFGRLAVLLLALADLAERAGRACPLVRCFVLWILWRAETFARAYVEEVAGTPIVIAEPQWSDETPDDALRLAQNLRALATLFRTLAHFARLAQKPSATPRGLIFLLRRAAEDRPRTATAFHARPFDTS